MAVSITKDNKDNGDGGDKKDEDNTCFTIVLKSGEIIKSKKVILAAGSFTNFNNLIDRKLKIDLKGHTVLMVEIGDKDVPELSSCPSMIYFFVEDVYVYLLPPIRYPNGKTYFKIGKYTVIGNAKLPEFIHMTFEFIIKYYAKTHDRKIIFHLLSGHSVFIDCTIAKDLTTSQEVKDWYCQDGSERQDTRDFLMTKFKHLFPEVNILISV